ncbi:MAG: ATP-binding protein, partial [Actinomycetota bacterium]|nr:ATP-binding protein [Actinomycetota bacterium]
LSTTLAAREDVHGRIEIILWVGIFSAVVGGGLGILLFVREISGRIKLLQENSRLLDGAAPLKPVRGGDEIATLARVLEETRNELARKEERRREAEADVIRSRDEADRANVAKSEFLSRMSHELRTPLNAILGFAQLLEMDDLRPDQRDGVKHIVEGGEHLLNLINEVLDISRIETGRLSISVEPVAIGPLIDESVALVRPMAAAEGITIRCTAVPQLGREHVLADRQRLKQIVLNLLSNGIKYNRTDGSVELLVSRTEDGVRLEVRDTGPGLTEDQLANLFTPFERLGAETTDVEGTGLGLALSKRLAEAMGARIAVSSRVGEGSAFCVDLVRTDAPATDPARAPRADPAEPRAGVQIATVLYVEDNPSNVQLVESILGRRPHIRLITAMQGRAGIDLAREHRPDVVLLDLNLPDVEGDEVLRILRADPRTSSIPVIMLSADATPRQIERLKSDGAFDYITKPIDVRRFLHVVDKTLEDAVA